MKPFTAIISTLLAAMFLVLSGGTANGQATLQAQFDEANRALETGQYRVALQHYRQLENRERISGALFLNMGIAHTRIDSLGMAKYYFLKARTFEETRSQAEQALEFVESRFSRQSAVLPKLPWERATEWILNRIGILPLFAGSIILLNLGILLFVSHWFLSTSRVQLYRSGIALAVLGILLLLVGLYVHHIDQRFQAAVMVTAEAQVLERPQPESSIISQAFEGYTFTVDRRESAEAEGWEYVRMSNGLYGWIPSDQVKRL